MFNPNSFLGSLKSVLNSRTTELIEMGEKYPESIVVRILWIVVYELQGSWSALAWCVVNYKNKIWREKKTRGSSQSATERVQIYMCEYWEKVKNMDPENLIFLD